MGDVKRSGCWHMGKGGQEVRPEQSDMKDWTKQGAHLLCRLQGRGALHWGLPERHAPAATMGPLLLLTLHSTKTTI